MESMKRSLFILLSHCAAYFLHGCIRTTSCQVQEHRKPIVRFRALQSSLLSEKCWANLSVVYLYLVGYDGNKHKRPQDTFSQWHQSSTTASTSTKGWNWGNLQPGRDRIMYRRHSSYTKISKLNGMAGNHQAGLGNKPINKSSARKPK